MYLFFHFGQSIAHRDKSKRIWRHDRVSCSLHSQCWLIHVVLQIINVLLITSVTSLCLIYSNAMDLLPVPCFSIRISNHSFALEKSWAILIYVRCSHFIACSSSKNCHQPICFPPAQRNDGCRSQTLILVKSTFQRIQCTRTLKTHMWYKYQYHCCCANLTISHFDIVAEQSKHKRICCGFVDFFLWKPKAANSCRFVAFWSFYR